MSAADSSLLESRRLDGEVGAGEVGAGEVGAAHLTPPLGILADVRILSEGLNGDLERLLDGDGGCIGEGGTVSDSAISSLTGLIVVFRITHGAASRTLMSEEYRSDMRNSTSGVVSRACKSRFA